MHCIKAITWKNANAALAAACSAGRHGLLCVAVLGGVLSACAPGTVAVQQSAAGSAVAAGMVDLQGFVPDLHMDLRYAGSANFVGTPITGYDKPICYLHRVVAAALAEVQRELRKDRLRLRIFDCYRPQRAVQHFIRWAGDGNDQATKRQYYPDIDKQRLLGDYIAPVSGHSRGATLDLTLETCAADQDCDMLDMGSDFDRFGPIARTDTSDITVAQQANRQRLRKVMQRWGFENYPLEWWHYTFKPEPTPTTYYDFPIR